eukprot:scaffold34440_cov45-Cyclotella_meneghiniana.AAC.2
MDIPVHASLSKIVEPVVDVPKSSKRRVVSEKYAKWKHGTLKNTYNPEEFIIEWGGYGIWLTYFGSSTAFLHCSKNICASSKPLLCQSFNTCGDAAPAETMKARVGAEAEFVENRPAEVDELEIFVFGCVGDGGANSAEVKADMTPPVLRSGGGERRTGDGASARLGGT